MKQYQITFAVPDDFNPDELELNAGYKDEITICDESYVSEDSNAASFLANISEGLLQFMKDNNIEISKESAGEHDVVVFKFPPEILQHAESSTYISLIRQQLEQAFGCLTIGIVNDIDLLVENADEAIKMLNGMLAKVKVRSAVKETTKILTI